MVYVIAGLVLGIIAGLNLHIEYNPQYAVYISLAILAIINTIFNIISENLKGGIKILKCIMLLVTDLAFALFLGYVGEQLKLPIYLAPVFAFGNNIYKNMHVMVEFTMEKLNKNQ